jgi:hypothetical protein
MKQVPESVNILKKQVDFFLEIHNPVDSEAPLVISERFPKEPVREIFDRNCAP